MKSYIEIAERTCRIDPHKWKKANNASQGNKYIWTAKKGDRVVIGSLTDIANELNRRSDQVVQAYYRSGRYLGYIIKRIEDV